MADWQDISTAPKDGTPILLYDDRVVVGWWGAVDPDGEAWKFLDTVCEGDHLNWWVWGYGPSHWQPLPKPPE